MFGGLDPAFDPETVLEAPEAPHAGLSSCLGRLRIAPRPGESGAGDPRSQTEWSFAPAADSASRRF